MEGESLPFLFVSRLIVRIRFVVTDGEGTPCKNEWFHPNGIISGFLLSVNSFTNIQNARKKSVYKKIFFLTK